MARVGIKVANPLLWVGEITLDHLRAPSVITGVFISEGGSQESVMQCEKYLANFGFEGGREPQAKECG